MTNLFFSVWTFKLLFSTPVQMAGNRKIFASYKRVLHTRSDVRTAHTQLRWLRARSKWFPTVREVPRIVNFGWLSFRKIWLPIEECHEKVQNAAAPQRPRKFFQSSSSNSTEPWPWPPGRAGMIREPRIDQVSASLSSIILFILQNLALLHQKLIPVLEQIPLI